MIRRPLATIALLATAGLIGTGVTTAITAPGTADSVSLTPFVPQLVRVDTAGAAERNELQSLGFDLNEGPGRGYTDVVLTTAAQAAALKKAGYSWTVRIPDLARREAQNRDAADAAYAATTKRSALPSGRTSYRTLDDYNTEMAAMAKQKPNLVKSITLKRPTLDGRTVYGVEIGAGVRRANHGQPTFFIMGAHHARGGPAPRTPWSSRSTW